MKKYAVIMAGGVGSRFWPQSRESFPKQFLNLYGERSLIQQTVDRIKSIVPVENILIITNKKYIPIVQEQLPELPLANILGEPKAKNTAPCVLLASELIHQRDESAVMAVLPADHVIKDENTYREILNTAFNKAEDDSAIVTIGINPSHPETGYGYIHFDSSTVENRLSNSVLTVHGFKEKPDVKTAESFLESGEYLWNSGMFFWSNKTIRSAFSTHQTTMFSLANRCFANSKGLFSANQLEEFFTDCESISVDYAIMEHAKNVFVVPGDFGWNDVGSWSAVYELNSKDNSGNVVLTNHASIVNSSNNYVLSKSGKLIALVGLQDIALIETVDAILVCNLNASQDVKKIVEGLVDDKKKFK